MGAGAGRAGPPVVPGYRVGPPVGFGASGAVWSATDRAGHGVVISVLPLLPGERGAAQLRRLATLRQVTHPHLPAVLEAVGLDRRRCAVVSAVVAGPSLATVRAARGPLSLAETGTLLTALGSALGHLHARGVVHGDVAPANVLLTAEGVPVLVDLAGEVAGERGTPGFQPPERVTGAPAGAAGDVWALARLLLWAAAEPAELAALLGDAAAADPADRPSARDLAARAPALGPPAPVTVPERAALAGAQLRARAAHTPTRRAPTGRGRRRRRRRGMRTAAVIVPVVAAVAWWGLPPSAGPAPPPGAAALTERDPGPDEQGLAGGGPGGSTDAPATEVTHPDTREETLEDVVRELIARRDAALNGDLAGLTALTVPGSAAAAQDAALTAALGGATVSGLRTEVIEVTPGGPASPAGETGGAVAQVRTRQGPYTLDAGGDLRHVGAQQVRCTSVTLAPRPWRVERTEPCP